MPVCVCVCVLVAQSCQLFATPWTGAHQAPLSVEFSRQEYWSGLPFPSPGDLPDPGIKPISPALQADSLPSEPTGKPINVRGIPQSLCQSKFPPHASKMPSCLEAGNYWEALLYGIHSLKGESATPLVNETLCSENIYMAQNITTGIY